MSCNHCGPIAITIDQGPGRPAAVRLVRNTGFRKNGMPCTCDARPFEAKSVSATDLVGNGKPAVSDQIVTRAEHQRDLIVQNARYADAVVALDDLMAWCRTVLGPVINLGQLSYYAEHAAFDVIAPRLLAELDGLEEGVRQAETIIRRLRTVALDAMGEGEVAA